MILVCAQPVDAHVREPMNAPLKLKPVDSFEMQTSTPFDFRHTFWKPSHFDTGLEKHSRERTWRTFRIREHFCGVAFSMPRGSGLAARVYSNSRWGAEETEALRVRLDHAYGLTENLTDFVRIASKVKQINAPLRALRGMRQSCPENLFEIAVLSLLLQNATIARTTQMMSNLLTHHGRLVNFDGVTLRTFFTPKEILDVPEIVFREKDRLGYRAKYIGRFAEFFVAHDPDAVATTGREALMADFQTIKGVGPYTAAIIASHAVRDHSALGLDVWNRRILAERMLSVEDAEPKTILSAMKRLFPGFEGLAALYFIEDVYRRNPVVPLSP